MLSRILESSEIQASTDEEARRLLERALGPAHSWRPQKIRRRLESAFQAHWSTEVGQVLTTAERLGFLPKLAALILARANQDLGASHDEALYSVFLQVLAEAVVTHYLVGTGFGFECWQPSLAGNDVDVVLNRPEAGGRTVDVQVKTPCPPERSGGWAFAAALNNNVIKGVRQLPAPARSASMLVLCPDRLCASDSAGYLGQILIGETACEPGWTRLLAEPRGAFFREGLSHVGAVSVLNYATGISSEEGRELSRYSFTVFLNPRADRTGLRPSDC